MSGRVLTSEAGERAITPGVDTRTLHPGATGTMAVGACGLPEGTWEADTGRDDLGQTLTTARATQGRMIYPCPP